ncbi:hypothetical protein ACQ4PT_041640 [Festuca glaucescens]
MVSPPQPAKRSLAVESYDILWLIFLKLDSAADLARACAASPAFRRVITDPRFLRDFHALHPPPLLGIISNVFLPAEQPHPSASAAHKLVVLKLTSIVKSAECRNRVAIKMNIP